MHVYILVVFINIDFACSICARKYQNFFALLIWSSLLLIKFLALFVEGSRISAIAKIKANSASGKAFLGTTDDELLPRWRQRTQRALEAEESQSHRLPKKRKFVEESEKGKRSKSS